MVVMRRPRNPQRSFDVTAVISLHEIVGRRPSAVYLDAALKPLVASCGPHRLNELVYSRGHAVPGEQIHLASGRTFVLDANNAYRGVLLIDPRSISAESALSHAHRERTDEQTKIEQLVLAGALVEARPRRTYSDNLPRYDRMYAADRPLIADPPAESIRAPTVAPSYSGAPKAFVKDALDAEA